MLTVDGTQSSHAQSLMVEIIAHRGASRDRPENTLAAFASAVEQGADGVELDVHRSADGVVVVHHDPIVVARSGIRYRIANTTWATLRQAELASGEGLPSLDEVMELVPNSVTVYVEVKAAGMEREVVDCLNRHPAASTAVHAFDHRIPIAVRALRPSTSIGLLSASYPVDMAAFIGTAAADALWQHADMIDARLVQTVSQLGSRVIAWTENEAGHAHDLVAMGVSAICTDIPGSLRKALKQD